MECTSVLTPRTRAVQGKLGAVMLGWSMVGFDHEKFQDDAIRHHYDRLLKRGERACAAMHGAYGDGRMGIALRYADMAEFNASAYADDGAYRIDIAHGAPLLVLLLFHKILADEEVMPWLGPNEDLVTDLRAPFIVDIRDFERRVSWDIGLSEKRAFAARMLADMASSFIIFHEIGHVASGHVEAIKALDQRSALLEMDSSAVARPEVIERRQAWEADADALSCTLLLEYAQQLIADIDVNPMTRAVFEVPEYQREHILALTAACLFALFFYMRGQQRLLKVTATHPDPYVRAMYCKDMLVSAARARWSIDQEMFARLMAARADEFLDALETAEIFDNRFFEGRHFERIDRENARILKMREKHRASALAWSWVAWDSGSDA